MQSHGHAAVFVMMTHIRLKVYSMAGPHVLVACG